MQHSNLQVDIDRRDFLRALGLTALAPTTMAFSPSSSLKKPVVISTWSSGLKANPVAWEILQKDGWALDAVEAGVRVVEDDPEDMSVGYGGLPDRDGHVTLDACIMDHEGSCGAVAFLQHIRHPISVARRVMEKTPHVMLVGEGALRFALSEGFPKENLLTEKAREAYQRWLRDSNYKPSVRPTHDTIGLLAMDLQGRICGACTTSGLAFKMHGRVGDSPIIGAGLYVDNAVGAATATGHGEEMIRCAGSAMIVEHMRLGRSPQEACEILIKRLYDWRKNRLEGRQVCFIALNRQGQAGAFSLRPGFEYTLSTTEGGHRLLKAPSLLDK